MVNKKNIFLLCFLSFVCLCMYSCAPPAQEDGDCKSRQIRNIVGKGDTKQKAKTDWDKKARQACYEECKRHDCTNKGNKPRVCILTAVTGPNTEATKTADGKFQYASKPTCKCACARCLTKTRMIYAADSLFTGRGNTISKAQKVAYEKAKKWCQTNACSKHKDCTNPRTCKVSKAVKAGKAKIEGAKPNFKATYEIIGCKCRCEK